MEQRRKELQRQGYVINRIAYYVRNPSKYEPHQGSKEAARRAKRMARTVEVEQS
jgi:membrane peptidoglycan carboxypeptidase